MIKRALVQNAPAQLAAEAGETLFESDNDEGIAEFRIAPRRDYVLSAINTTVPWNSDTNDLWVISLNARQNKRITQDNAGYRDLEWSPDGSLISYISREGIGQGSGDTGGETSANLYTHDLKTGKRKRLLQRTVSYAWLPTHRLLVATSRGRQGLLLLDPDSGKEESVPGSAKGGDLAVSSNARFIAWWHDERLEIVELPTAGPEIRRPALWKSLYSIHLPSFPERFAFSPDGRFLALSLPVFGADIRLPRQLAVISIADGRVGVLGTVVGVPSYLRWSSNGHSMVFVRGTFGKAFFLSLSSVDFEEPKYSDPASADWTNKQEASVREVVRFPYGGGYIDWADTE